MASLFVVRGNDQGCRYELEPMKMTIGRDVGNRIQLHDTEVSRRHAVVRREGTRLRLRRQQSSNGTFVNGRRIADAHACAAAKRFSSAARCCCSPAAATNRAELAEQDRHRRAASPTIARESCARCRRPKVATCSRCPSRRLWCEHAPLGQARSNLDVMYRTTMAVRHTLDIDQLLHAVMQLIFEWVECDRGCVMLLDADSEAARAARAPQSAVVARRRADRTFARRFSIT